MHHTIIDLIDNITKITEEDKQLCEKYFEPIFYTKSTIIEHEKKIPKYLYFILSGYVRIFYIDEKGNEITTHINCQTGFITSYSDFIHQTKTNENLQCITDCQLLRITKQHLDMLIQKSPALKDFSIWVFQQSLSYNENRSKELAILSAEQRYTKLIETQPDILQNVPIQYIASFLGMNPKSLSRIRKQIIR